MIETGRFSNLPPESRLCNYCDKNVIEDELHFLIECNNYDELRSTFYEKCRQENCSFEELTSEEIFTFIFIMNNNLIINDSMNFVYDIFHKRKND